MTTVADESQIAAVAAASVLDASSLGAAGREACRPPISPLPSQLDAGQLPGLVSCRKTGREASVAELLGLSEPVVERSELVSARGQFRSSGWDLHVGESPNPRLLISPGALVWTRTSQRQESRQIELAEVNRRAAVDAAARVMADNPGWRPNPVSAREITGWSRESRANMLRQLASIDWAPLYETGRAAGMVTLTYPGDWQTVAPDGKTVKAQLKTFRKRYQRAWREPLIAAWKLEFQHRGAPHIHLFMAPPHGLSAGRGSAARLDFRRWLSMVWADVVDHPDPVERMKHELAGTAVDYGEGLKCQDPKRLAMYFGKHGSYAAKDYQNCVPDLWQAPGAGPGRFWGYWGLSLMVAIVDMSPADYRLSLRIMRRHAARAQRWDGEAGRHMWVKPMRTVTVYRRRIDYQTGEVRRRKRKVRRFAGRLGSGAGFSLVNNGPSIATELARAISVCGESRG